MNITVVGDLLLDRDLVGTVHRICPDAPVPVLDVEDEVARPGGAGLAAALLAADGQSVSLVSSVANDGGGERLSRLVRRYGVRLVGLPTDGMTREKARVRAANQSLMRLDFGSSCPPSQMTDAAVQAIDSCDALLVCDYAGGVTQYGPLRAALASAAVRRPVVWDPHTGGSPPVPGVRVVAPNQEEAAALSAVEMPKELSTMAAAARHADALRTRWGAHAVCVTMGPRGALLTYGDGAPLVVPADTVRAGDVCGAGDRFASTLVFALATGSVVSTAVQRAVASATSFVSAGGASAFPSSRRARAPETISGWDRVEDVRIHGGTVVATGGCFDLLHAGHIALLHAARGLGDCLIVCVNSDDSVRRLKGQQRPLVPEADRMRVLEALECVDAVTVFEEDTPDEMLKRLRPDLWVKGGDYTLADLPEAETLSQWGGQTVVVPYLDGRSTTTLIDTARGSIGSPKETA
jgi:rfaE bifunctional protein nucleotidyltransferase chain/domain/rfaE bifunctional protein kinase chain/domain